MAKVPSRRQKAKLPYIPLKYSSVAISGKPGAGRSTLLSNLKPYLLPLGWKFFSGGDWSRKFSIKVRKHNPCDKSHHFATDYGEDIDHKIDLAMRKKLSDRDAHIAVESWISGWNMRGLKHVLKVLLMCNDALRIDRIVNRDGLTVQEAKDHIKVREAANIGKWKKMYKTDEFWDPKHYDLVINTYSHSPKETLDLVLQALGYYKINGQKAER